MTKKQDNYTKVANRVAWVTVIVNLMLALGKLLAGILAHSSAMVSDAVHSASDIFSTFVVMIGIRMAAKSKDKEHPYGHERMECVAAIVLAVVLLITGLGIGVGALKTILSGHYEELVAPGIPALMAAIASIVIKEAMYWYTRFYAKKIDSAALMADAWHHRTDAFSSVGALIGILGARMGFPVMDAVASLVIFLFIAKAAFDIFKDAMNKMVDHACDEETQEAIRKCILQNTEVQGIDLLQTRVFGNRIYVDLEIRLDGRYSLQKAHGIAEEVHDSIEREFDRVKHIMVHVNPDDV